MIPTVILKERITTEESHFLVILNPSEARGKNHILLKSFVPPWRDAPPTIGPPEALQRRVNG